MKNFKIGQIVKADNSETYLLVTSESELVPTSKIGPYLAFKAIVMASTSEYWKERITENIEGFNVDAFRVLEPIELEYFVNVILV
ncbi:hypothetical protein [Elizabethkingia phage TCUEAP1]|nr:hypothetical protein [Elizabethkingia phage TCUEAP1]